MVGWKFTKFLMSCLEPRVSFSSNFVPLFSVMKQLFCIFSSNSLYALDKRIQSKCKFSYFRLLSWKLTKCFMLFFKPQVSFPLNFASPFSVMTHNPLKFSNWNIICFGQKEPINVQFFRFLSALMKVHPIFYAIFETTKSKFIQILYHYSVPWKIILLYFLAQTSYTLDKNSPSKWNF